MKEVGVSDTGGRYTKGILSAGVFTPEQTRYLQDELEKIVAVVANHDEALGSTKEMVPSAVITATIASFTSSVVQMGNTIKTTIIADLVGAKSVASDLDIIGDTGVCHFGQIKTAVNGYIYAGQVGCAVVPTTGADDIDLYSAAEGTGAYDGAVTDLTEKALMTSGGAHAIGTVKPFTVLPEADEYLYLVSGEASAGTYDSGTLIIEMWGSTVAFTSEPVVPESLTAGAEALTAGAEPLTAG